MSGMEESERRKDRWRFWRSIGFLVLLFAAAVAISQAITGCAAVDVLRECASRGIGCQ